MILTSKDGLEVYADCHCGCDSGLRFHIDPDDITGLYCAVFFLHLVTFIRNNRILLTG